MLRDKNWSYLDTFDSLTPHFASTHEKKDIIKWLKYSNFKKIKKTFWGNTSFKAQK